MPSIVTSGTIGVTNGSAAVTGVGTPFELSAVREGDLVLIDATAGRAVYVVGADATSDTSLTLSETYSGDTESGLNYTILRMYGASTAAEAAQTMRRLLALIEQTPGLSVTDFDAVVEDLSALSAHDDDPEGTTVLVRDNTGVTDGADRAAYYIMGSGGSADWSDPFWVTGPKGPAGDVTGVGVSVITYITQAEYDLLDPPVSTTVYLIID